MLFKVHIAIGVLLIALAAGCHLICRATCGKDECTPACKLGGKIVGGLIALIAILSLACTIYCGATKIGCGKGKCGKKTCPHSQTLQLEEGAAKAAK